MLRVTVIAGLVRLSQAEGVSMDNIQSVEAGLTPLLNEMNQLSAHLLQLHRSLSSSPTDLKETILLEIEQLALKQQSLMQSIMQARQNSKTPYTTY